MDKLAEKLCLDAEQIEVVIDAELQHRIDASLHSVQPRKINAAARPPLFWWASSLTGLAAAAVTIVLINQFADRHTTLDLESPATRMATAGATPLVEWKTQPAMLTGPLHAELAALQADIKKAEQKVKEDIGL